MCSYGCEPSLQVQTPSRNNSVLSPFILPRHTLKILELMDKIDTEADHGKHMQLDNQGINNSNKK